MGVTPSDIVGDGEVTTSPHMMVGLPHPKPKGTRVCEQTTARTKTGQLPSSQRNYQECSRQTTRRRITGGKEVHWETMVYKQRPFKQTPNNIKDQQVTAKEVSQGD